MNLESIGRIFRLTFSFLFTGFFVRLILRSVDSAEFDASWINRYHVWNVRWAQPVVELKCSKLIPSSDGPLPGFYICSMAQIYPEDRGTNYAIREGIKIAKLIFKT